MTVLHVATPWSSLVPRWPCDGTENQLHMLEEVTLQISECCYQTLKLNGDDLITTWPHTCTHTHTPTQSSLITNKSADCFASGDACQNGNNSFKQGDFLEVEETQAASYL